MAKTVYSTCVCTQMFTKMTLSALPMPDISAQSHFRPLQFKLCIFRTIQTVYREDLNCPKNQHTDTWETFVKAQHYITIYKCIKTLEIFIMPPRQNISKTSLIFNWNYQDFSKMLLPFDEIVIKNPFQCQTWNSLTDNFYKYLEC